MMGAHRSFVTFLFPAALLIAAPACASQGYYSYSRDRDYDRGIERRAFDNGYAEGLSSGERDARGGRTFSPERHDDYRDADDGYRRGEGDREWYRRVFRQGFQAGYSAGFNRLARDRGYAYGFPGAIAPYRYPGPYPPAGPSARYVSPATQAGYRDGYKVGRNDARDRESYDPVRSSRYRSADHDYSGRYGPKDEYRREYRAAFAEGYERGYRESRRY